MEGSNWLVVLFLLLAVGERLFERRFSSRAVRGERKMEWSYVALHSGYVIIFALTAAEYFLAHRALHWGMTTAGLAAYGLGLVVRLTAIRTLGKFWSLHLEIRQDHQLVTHGIYQHVRHPAYVAIMLEIVAVPLVANALGTLGIALMMYVPLLLLRWRREESEMIEKFGERYAQYCRNVPAFIPWRSRTRGARQTARGRPDLAGNPLPKPPAAG